MGTTTLLLAAWRKRKDDSAVILDSERVTPACQTVPGVGRIKTESIVEDDASQEGG